MPGSQLTPTADVDSAGHQRPPAAYVQRPSQLEFMYRAAPAPVPQYPGAHTADSALALTDPAGHQKPGVEHGDGAVAPPAQKYPTGHGPPLDELDPAAHQLPEAHAQDPLHVLSVYELASALVP